MKGIYVLILRMKESKDIRVGKLGRLHFRRGYYAYVGSAQGSGGDKRVKRHFSVAHGRNTTRKWHIDYLLPHSEVICAVFSPTDEALECVVARLLGEKTLRKFYQTKGYGLTTIPQHCASRSFVFSEALPAFGCSDCTCESHLFFTGGNIMGEASDICEGVSGNESIIIYPNM